MAFDIQFKLIYQGIRDVFRVRSLSHKFKTAFGKKGRMIPADDVEALVGHAPGGVCPFAIKDGVPVYLDTSLHAYETVYPAAGDDHSAIRMTPEELFRFAHAAGWVDIHKEG